MSYLQGFLIKQNAILISGQSIQHNQQMFHAPNVVNQ
jgi:hypothetical protein